MANFSKILIPVDFTECSISVLPYAKLMAEKFSAELHLVYTLPGIEQYRGLSFEDEWSSTYSGVLKTEAQRAMENFVQQHLQDCQPTTTMIRSGETVAEIVSYADEKGIDLIIMGSHGCHTAEHRIYGSVAEAVSRSSGCPVMIVNPD